MGDIPKGAMLKGLEQQMYQEFKISEYAAGRTPASFDDWKKTLSSDKPSKPKEQSNIEYGFPERKRVKDSKKKNKKLNEIWESEKMEDKNIFMCTKCKTEKDKKDFYKNNSSRGHESWCKECKKEDQKKRQQNEDKEVLKIELKKDIVPGVTSKSQTFTLTKEELLEFGKAAYERGRNSVQTLSKETKDSLLDEICEGKAS